MSQFGMQMPGGQLRRGPVMNVYTGLLFMAVLALAVACVMMYSAASRIGKDGSPFGMHEPASAGNKDSGLKFGN